VSSTTPRCWSPERDARIVELRGLGLSATMIAAQIGATAGSVKGRFDKLIARGLAPRIGAGPKAGSTGWIDRCAHLIEYELNTGCWLWSRRTDKCGYGLFKIGGRAGREKPVHRASWEHHFGPIPEGLFVLHRCDTPPCCNPNHLFLGTLAENNEDRHRKGRTFCKLTDAQVAEIRARHASGERGKEMLPDYPVSPALIYYVIAGKKRPELSLQRLLTVDTDVRETATVT
jgi:hypothetical protein